MPEPTIKELRAKVWQDPPCGLCIWRADRGGCESYMQRSCHAPHWEWWSSDANRVALGKRDRCAIAAALDRLEALESELARTEAAYDALAQSIEWQCPRCGDWVDEDSCATCQFDQGCNVVQIKAFHKAPMG